MTIDPETLEALRSAAGDARLDSSTEALTAASHDTWPLSTKLAKLHEHPWPAELVIRLNRFDELPELLRTASRHQIPVTVRACGSSVTGQPLPTRGGVVLDVSTVPPTFALDERNLTVTASASMPGGELEDALANAGYTVVLATGETVTVKASPRAAMGPDLRRVFLGSEGTLGVITSVTLKVFPTTVTTRFAAYRLATVEDGIEILREQAALGLRPLLLRLYDATEAAHAAPGETQPVLFVGTRGPETVADAELRVLDGLITGRAGVPLGAAPVERWMGRRFDFSTVENLLDEPGGYAETIEVAHTWSGIGDLYHALTTALAPLADEVLGHFSHVYPQGTSLYVILLGRAPDDAEAVRRLRTIWETAMQICLDQGAELSHHHGGGMARSAYARRSLGSAHVVLQRLKSALDPAGILNPGKLGL